MAQTNYTRKMNFIYQPPTTECGQRRGCLFYDLGCSQNLTHSSCQHNLWSRISTRTQTDLPSLDNTELERPFCDLRSRNIFTKQVLTGTAK
ncbi:MAG TPA: hypothetical protein VK203_07090 [Nostocaceae cyanobacterium]|nr:hypothetical protein [Nostocaceae cyanobacterium]